MSLNRPIPATLLAAMLLLLGAMAFPAVAAQDGDGYPINIDPDEVVDDDVIVDDDLFVENGPVDRDLGVADQRPGAQVFGLAITGSSILIILGIALVLLAVGVLLSRSQRHRRGSAIGT